MSRARRVAAAAFLGLLVGATMGPIGAVAGALALAIIAAATDRRESS